MLRLGMSLLPGAGVLPASPPPSPFGATVGARRRTTRNSSSESVLPESDLNDLHRLVGSPEFAALSNSYVPPEGVCCDFFFYTVTAQVGDRTIESNTADTLDTPPVLQQVIELLLGLMS